MVTCMRACTAALHADERAESSEWVWAHVWEARVRSCCSHVGALARALMYVRACVRVPPAPIVGAPPSPAPPDASASAAHKRDTSGGDSHTRATPREWRAQGPSPKACACARGSGIC
eukprot:5846026-Pleurochrysis_carterae.AAC.1